MDNLKIEKFICGLNYKTNIPNHAIKDNESKKFICYDSRKNYCKNLVDKKYCNF